MKLLILKIECNNCESLLVDYNLGVERLIYALEILQFTVRK